MANFKEYLAKELNKSTDEQVKTTIIRKADKDLSVDDILSTVKPNIWTAREINNIKYLFFGGKVLNITQLKKEINQLYDIKGYSNYGFAKLDESELIRYTKVKNILIQAFSVEPTEELNPESVANRIFNNELKEFNWIPEEY